MWAALQCPLLSPWLPPCQPVASSPLVLVLDFPVWLTCQGLLSECIVWPKGWCDLSKTTQQSGVNPGTFAAQLCVLAAPLAPQDTWILLEAQQMEPGSRSSSSCLAGKGQSSSTSDLVDLFIRQCLKKGRIDLSVKYSTKPCGLQGED